MAAAGQRAARKGRIDRLVVTRGLTRSRERAQALLMAGLVRVDGHLVDKPGTLVPQDAEITVIEPDHPFVGRGGVKLDGALDLLDLEVRGRTAIDIGASTGGFTDCLLRRGVSRVYAVDVGSGQLDWSLRQDARVVVMEKLNARYLSAGDLPEPVGLAVADVSFISLRLILPALSQVLSREADLVVLVKPQFELGRGEVGAGGIVRDPVKHLAAIEMVSGAAIAIGFRVKDACRSPIEGAEGNREFFLHLKTSGPGLEVTDRERVFRGLVDVEN